MRPSSSLTISSTAAARTDRRQVVFAIAPADRDGVLSAYPTEHDAGSAFTIDELSALSTALAPLYVTLSTSLGGRLAAAVRIDGAAAQALVRAALVPLVNFFFTRLAVLDRMVATHGRQSMALAATDPIAVPETLDEYMARGTGSDSFNQHLLNRLGGLWALPVDDQQRASQPAVASVAAKNFNFSGLTWQSKVRRRVRSHWSSLLRALPMRRPSIAAVSIGYAANALMEAGLYGPGRLAEPETPAPAAIAARDQALRSALFHDAVNASADAISGVLSHQLFEQSRTTDVASALAAFLISDYPPTMLEGAADRLEKRAATLRPYAPRPLLIGDIGGEAAAFSVAAARALKMPVFGCQHGGHYGYLHDFTAAIELEYALCDRFVSWGWTRLPEHPALEGVGVLPMSSPWLSVRARTWAARRTPAGRRPYAFLWMTNKVKRYPSLPAGAGISTINNLRPFRQMLIDMVSASARHQLPLLHKPYNKSTEQLLSQTFAELVRLGGANYTCDDRPDKGLTPVMLDRCDIVLWDQPGTGFLECLAGRIPTMVYWPRIFNRESPWCVETFSQLEAAGIVHSDADRLCEEALRLRRDPVAWMSDSHRAGIVDAFVHEFGRVEPRWRGEWDRFVGGLAS